jgi:hypothetical protein
VAVDAGIVSWLKTGALYARSTDATLAANWGTDAIDIEAAPWPPNEAEPVEPDETGHG